MFTFLKNFANGIRGDYDENPGARPLIWLGLIMGLAGLGLTIYAAYIGFPAYASVMSFMFAAQAVAFIMVLLISFSIFILSGIIALFVVEKFRYKISRISGDKIVWLIIAWLIFVSFDMFMNFKGGKKRIDDHSNAQKIELASTADFRSSVADKIETLETQITQLETAKGCKGDGTCRNTCPYADGGAAHNNRGGLTKYGRAELRRKRALLTPLLVKDSTETAVNAFEFETKKTSINSEVEDQRQITYLIIAGVYFMVQITAIIGVVCVLAFEQADGLGYDYQAALIRRIEDREAEVARRQKMKVFQAENKIRREAADKANRKRLRDIKAGKIKPAAPAAAPPTQSVTLTLADLDRLMAEARKEASSPGK